MVRVIWGLAPQALDHTQQGNWIMPDCCSTQRFSMALDYTLKNLLGHWNPSNGTGLDGSCELWVNSGQKYLLGSFGQVYRSVPVLGLAGLELLPWSHWSGVCGIICRRHGIIASYSDFPHVGSCWKLTFYQSWDHSHLTRDHPWKNILKPWLDRLDIL